MQLPPQVAICTSFEGKTISEKLRTLSKIEQVSKLIRDDCAGDKRNLENLKEQKLDELRTHGLTPPLTFPTMRGFDFPNIKRNSSVHFQILYL